MFSTGFTVLCILFATGGCLAGRGEFSTNATFSFDYHERVGALQDVLNSPLVSGNSSNDTKCEHPWRNRTGLYNSSCQFVRDNCGDIAVLADYLAFIICDFPSYKWFTYSVLILWLLYLISLLATTADYFFVPPLNLLSQKLKLSPSVAGITLLAVGNGAPDVFTAYAALSKANDLPLELSALLGASIFILTVVLGSVILVSDVSSNTIRRTDFVRDILAYIVVVALVVVVSMDGKIYLYESASFLIAYMVYIAVVVGLGYLKRRGKSGEHGPLLEGSGKSIATDNSTALLSINDPSDNEDMTLAGLSWPRKKSWAVKFQFIMEYPFSILRWLTVPSSDEEWDLPRWTFAILSPIPAAFLILVAAQGWDGFNIVVSELPIYAVIIIAGAPFSVALFALFLYKWRCHPTGNLDPGSVVLFISGAVAFITSVAWMNIQANEVVAVLQTFGIIFDVSIAVLGVTVLAIGNSVGDWVADTTVARQGKPAMGVSSCFGSPLLNDVLGLGISLTAYTVKNFPHPFPLDVKSKDFKTVIFCWIMLSVTLVIHAVAFPLSRFTPPRLFSGLLFALYIAFTLFNVLEVTNVVGFAF